MSGLNWRTVLTVVSGTLVFVGTGAVQARERHWVREHWEHRHEHWEHRHHYVPRHHEHYYESAPRVIHERQPVVVMPTPVYAVPANAPPANPSLNFNFTVPLR